jgi:uncharacterized protein (DUF1684 family)
MTAQQIDTFADEWERWYAEHQKVLGDPHGFLAITSLNWLSAQPQRFGDAPGTPAYAPDRRRVATGRYVPFDQPRPTTVGAAVEGLQHVYDSPCPLPPAENRLPVAIEAGEKIPYERD